MKRIGPAALLAFLVAGAGCAGVSRVYFRPAGEAYEFGPAVPAARYRIPEQGDRPLIVQAACLGIVAQGTKDGRGARAEFEIRVKNKTGAEVTFPVAAFTLRDDEGHESGPAALDDQPPDKAGAPVSVADGERGAFAFSFDAAPLADPSRIGSLRLGWSAKFGGQETARETKFVRFEVRDEGWPAPYYTFGARTYRAPYWIGVYAPLPPYYYDPYFDDPWFRAY